MATEVGTAEGHLVPPQEETPAGVDGVQRADRVLRERPLDSIGREGAITYKRACSVRYVIQKYRRQGTKVYFGVPSVKVTARISRPHRRSVA